MHKVIIALASNHGQEEHLHQAHLCLEQVLFSCHYTEAIWTEPYGSKKGETAREMLYLNQLCYAETSLSAPELEAQLKAIEREIGRTAEDRAQGIVRIDLDLLLHDEARFHERDWNRPYIQCLLEKGCQGEGSVGQ